MHWVPNYVLHFDGAPEKIDVQKSKCSFGPQYYMMCVFDDVIQCTYKLHERGIYQDRWCSLAFVNRF